MTTTAAAMVENLLSCHFTLPSKNSGPVVAEESSELHRGFRAGVRTELLVCVEQSAQMELSSDHNAEATASPG